MFNPFDQPTSQVGQAEFQFPPVCLCLNQKETLVSTHLVFLLCKHSWKTKWFSRCYFSVSLPHHTRKCIGCQGHQGPSVRTRCPGARGWQVCPHLGLLVASSGSSAHSPQPKAFQLFLNVGQGCRRALERKLANPEQNQKNNSWLFRRNEYHLRVGSEKSTKLGFGCFGYKKQGIFPTRPHPFPKDSIQSPSHL